MEIEMAKSLMKLFFHAPASHGIIVFEDNDYLGVILKRDIEIGIMEEKFSLYENINMIKVKDLSQTLFRNNASKNLRVPVIDKAGTLLRIISSEEFQCQFFFEEYLPHFKILGVFEEMEHPMVITNHFKKTIFANRKALELTEMDIEGKMFSVFMSRFEIKTVGDFLIVEKKGVSFNLIVSRSESRNFSYFIYLFVKI
jgi:hypothetical protein